MAYEKLPDAVARPRQALVVDDEPASRACLSALLVSIGLDVEVVASGSELLQRLELCPDLILLDTGRMRRRIWNLGWRGGRMILSPGL
jgi:DNA-binding NtrC family response regulator